MLSSRVFKDTGCSSSKRGGTMKNISATALVNEQRNRLERLNKEAGRCSVSLSNAVNVAVQDLKPPKTIRAQQEQQRRREEKKQLKRKSIEVISTMTPVAPLNITTSSSSTASGTDAAASVIKKGRKSSKFDITKVKSIPTNSECIELDTLTIHHSQPMWLTQMKNYTIISTADFTPFVKHAPIDLHETLHKNWLYAVLTAYGASAEATVRPENILQRVYAGQCLAYRLTHVSIMGTDAYYCGFIPTVWNAKNHSRLHPHVHRENLMSSKAEWPRKLYISLEYKGPCNCTLLEASRKKQPPTNIELCSRWLVQLRNTVTQRVYCLREIPWHKIYVMMGAKIEDKVADSEDEGGEGEIRPAQRSCVVCAQCYECSKRVDFCRRHKVCNHTQAALWDLKLDETTGQVIAVTTSKEAASIVAQQNDEDDCDDERGEDRDSNMLSESIIKRKCDEAMVRNTKIKTCSRYKP